MSRLHAVPPDLLGISGIGSLDEGEMQEIT